MKHWTLPTLTLLAASLLESTTWARPNIVLIIADDQDISLATPEIMPHLYNTIGQHGKKYEHFFAPVSLCCPSRVSLLRGQYAHNHNVTYVELPWGSWTKFLEFGYNGNNHQREGESSIRLMTYANRPLAAYLLAKSGI